MMPNRCLENPVFFLPDLADSFTIPGRPPRPAAPTSGSPSAAGACGSGPGRPSPTRSARTGRAPADRVPSRRRGALDRHKNVDPAAKVAPVLTATDNPGFSPPETGADANATGVRKMK